MSNELRIYRFAPDQPGKGGTNTGMNAFLGIEDTRRVEGLRPYNMMWQRDMSATRLSYQYTLGSKVTTFLEWWYNVGSTGALSKQLIGLTYLSGGLWKQTYTVLSGLTQNELYSTIASATQPPMTMLPVKDRLFLATGNTSADGLSYPTMIWNGVTVGSAPTNTSLTTLGVPSPTIAPTLSVAYNYSSGLPWYGMQNSYYIGNPDLGANESFDGLVEGEVVRLTHSTLTNPNYIQLRVVKRESGTTYNLSPLEGPYPVGVSQKITGVAGDAFAFFDLDVPAESDGTSPQFAGAYLKVGTTKYPIAAVTSNKIWFMAGTMPSGYANTVPGGGWASITSWQISGVRVTLDGVTPGASGTMGTTANLLLRPVAGTGYTSWTGVDAPGYAYAYYDSVTGHISNLSPIAYVPEENVTNGQISVDIRRNSTVACANGDTGTSGSSSTTGIQYVGEQYSREAARFAHILWFRTRRSGGGAMLYPLGSLNPAAGATWFGISGNPATISGGGTWTDGTDDSKLLLSSRIRPPLTTNFQPRIVNGLGVASRIIPWGMAWWDGRVWMYGPPDMGALHYSCDDAQNCMGRPEECFPDGNRLTIPAGDVEITSILTVGQYLVVNTRKYTWVVMGNHETNYRLVRISTELGGLKLTSCCEIPMSGEGQGVMACVTADQRVLLVDMGGGVEDIGRPIRDALAAPIRGIQFYRAGGHPRLLISVGQEGDWSSTPGNVAGMVYEYNFDHKIWTKNPPDLSAGVSSPSDMVEALGTVYRTSPAAWPNLGQSESFPVYGVDGAIWGDLAGNPKSNRVWNIGGFDLPRDAPKRRYSLAWVRILLATPPDVGIDGIHGPYLTVTADDASDSTDQFFGVMHEHADPARRSYPTNTGLGLDAKEFIAYGVELEKGYASAFTGTRPQGYKLRVNVQASLTYDALRYSIPYVEVALREESEDGVVDP